MSEKSLDTRSVLTLLRVKNFGQKTVRYFLQIVAEDPTDITDIHETRRIIIDNKDNFKRINSKFEIPTINDIQDAAESAEKIIENSYKKDISLLCFNDSMFPEQLREIPNPPLILYARGNIECINQNTSVAVVGTRNPTAYGEKAAEKLGAFFAKEGLTVVSGLALGCDSAAHEGCTSEHGTAIAVMAHGLDRIYPRQNENLAQKILRENGCLISEYPPETRPSKHFFIERDRLQSGISEAVVVIETDVKGGTMHTVEYALKQNRLLFCINHPPKLLCYDQTRGNQMLINDKKALPLTINIECNNLDDKFTFIEYNRKYCENDIFPQYKKRLELTTNANFGDHPANAVGANETYNSCRVIGRNESYLKESPRKSNKCQEMVDSGTQRTLGLK